jgi:NADH:ubiquinone reductase (H+-translocating)
MQVVIAGAGFGGVKAALELAKDPTMQVTLVSDKSHFLYYPALYGTATGHSHLESVVPLASIFDGIQNVRIVEDKITGIDLPRKILVGENNRYNYDNVILALGVVTTYFGIAGLEDNTFSIKSFDEVKEFKAHLHDELTEDRELDKNYVVVGAGPTGVELSAALMTYLNRIAALHKVQHGKINIQLVEAAPRVLPRMSEHASKIVEKQLMKIGVTVMTNKKVEAASADDITIEGQKLETETIIWTSGVTNNPFFKQHEQIFRLAKNGKVQVDENLRGAPYAYVIGDNADTPFTGLAQTALHDAIYIAKHLKSVAHSKPVARYKPRKPPVVVPVGENWAIFEWGPLRFGGIIASLIRRAADFIGYHDLLPIGQALGVWRAQLVTEEACEVCNEAMTRQKLGLNP